VLIRRTRNLEGWRHGTVHHDGRWTLPRQLALRTAWSDVLDLTRAVSTGPELVIEMWVSGGRLELVLAPRMAVDANALKVRYGNLAISRDAGDSTPETLHVPAGGPDAARPGRGPVAGRAQ
jgi:hypothetical protein